MKCVFNAICDFFEIEESERSEFEEILSRRKLAVQKSQFAMGTVLMDGTSDLSFYVVDAGNVRVIDVNSGNSVVLGKGHYISCIDKDLQVREVTANVVEDTSLWHLSHRDIVKLQYIYGVYRMNNSSQKKSMDDINDVKCERTNNCMNIEKKNPSSSSSITSGRSSPPSLSSSSVSLSSSSSQLRRGRTGGGSSVDLYTRGTRDSRVAFNPTVQVILMARKEEYAAWGVKDDIWYNERDYMRFRTERAIAASMGEEDIYFGARGVEIRNVNGSPVTDVFGKHELDDTLSKASRE